MGQKQLRHLEGNPAASLEWVWIGALEVWRLGGFPFKNQGIKSPTPPIQTNNSGLAEPLPFRRKKNEKETTTTVPCFCGVPLPNPAPPSKHTAGSPLQQLGWMFQAKLQHGCLHMRKAAKVGLPRVLFNRNGTQHYFFGAPFGLPATFLQEQPPNKKWASHPRPTSTKNRWSSWLLEGFVPSAAKRS